MRFLSDRDIQEIKENALEIIPCSEHAKRDREWLILLVREVEYWRTLRGKELMNVE